MSPDEALRLVLNDSEVVGSNDCLGVSKTATNAAA